MSAVGDQSRWLVGLRRIFGWKPVSYWQVWLVAAAPGVVLFVAWSARGDLMIGAGLGVVLTLVCGAAGSYRLGRRADAATVAEWTSRRRIPPEP